MCSRLDGFLVLLVGSSFGFEIFLLVWPVLSLTTFQVPRAVSKGQRTTQHTVYRGRLTCWLRVLFVAVASSRACLRVSNSAFRFAYRTRSLLHSVFVVQPKRLQQRQIRARRSAVAAWRSLHPVVCVCDPLARHLAAEPRVMSSSRWTRS